MSGKKASRTAPKSPVLTSPMRLDASKTEAPDWTTPRVCKCGCGQKFIPATKHHFYYGDHRKNAWINRNAGVIAVSRLRKENVVIRTRLDRIEAKFGIGKEGL